MVVDEEGLAWECPIGTEKYIRWEIVGDDEVHLGGVKAPHSGDLNSNRGELAAKPIEETREIEGVNRGSGDARFFRSRVNREGDFVLPKETVACRGGHRGEGIVKWGGWAVLGGARIPSVKQ